MSLLNGVKITEYSVVVPVMNEEGNVRLLYDKIKHAMDGMGAPYEIIFVDDGSTDSTFPTLECIKDTDPNLKVVKFRTNFGQSAAMLDEKVPSEDSSNEHGKAQTVTQVQMMISVWISHKKAG